MRDGHLLNFEEIDKQLEAHEELTKNRYMDSYQRRLE
jgi:hypothetical protein